MSLWNPGKKLQNNLTSSLDIPTPQTDQCTLRAPSLYFECVCLLCFCVCLCVYPALVSRTWRHWLRDTTAQRHTATSEKIFEGTQNFPRKDIFCRFCILRPSVDQSGTHVFVSFCVVSWEGGAQVGKGH